MANSAYTKTAIRKSMAHYGMSRGEFEREMKAQGVIYGMLPGEPPLMLLQRWMAEQPPADCDRCDSAPQVTELDGDRLCQSCANAWVRGEGVAAREALPHPSRDGAGSSNPDRLNSSDRREA